ncbi:MAG: hypothetical protein DHS20C04_32100 [Hyphococcus sp.]|nr:MAG: hypothetical protein DHS20C04_32100 [Marinicaulis sp.]
MAFQNYSSCDFVTRLPQCPKNKLPLYKEFSKEDLEDIKIFMGTKEYRKLQEQSRYLIAYFVEQNLQTPTEWLDPFSLLLSGIWYDGVNTYDDAEYISILLQEAAPAIGKADLGEQPYITAIAAYLNSWFGDVEDARGLLDSISPNILLEDEYLRIYVEKIEECMAAGRTDRCSPDSLIRFDDLLSDE